MQYIAVRFNFHGMHYTYKTDEECEAGDKVVVHNRDTNITSIAHVVEVLEDYTEDPTIEYTWIVQRVDFTNYLEHVGTMRNNTPTAKGRL